MKDTTINLKVLYDKFKGELNSGTIKKLLMEKQNTTIYM